MTRYTNILLDLDETLFDFKKAEQLAFDYTMDAYNIPNSDELRQFYTVTNESLWKALERKETTKEILKPLRFTKTIGKARELAPGFEPSADTTGEALNVTYIDSLARFGIYIDGAEEFLRQLHADKSKKIYIITNGTASSANGRLDASGIREYIDKAYISDVIGATKPDKGFFEHVLSDIGCTDKSTCLVVGDSLTSDIKGANNIGIDACLYSRDGHFPDATGYDVKYHAAGYDELMQVIQTPYQPGS